MNHRSDVIKAHLALLGANLFYGACFTVAKLVMPRLIAPEAFILIRVVCTCLLFWLSFMGGAAFRTKFEKKDWRRLVLGGMFGVAINQLFFFKGLNLTQPIHASLIMLSTPILITFIAAFILRERITAVKLAGLILGVGGAVFLIAQKAAGNGGTNVALGDFMVFLNAASYAGYLVLIKPLMAKYRPVIVIRWVFLFGALIVLPFGWSDFAAIEWQRFAWTDYLAVGFIVVCCTFCTYLWNTYALRKLSASTAGAYIYLQPLFAAIIAVLFYGETLTWQKLVSALFIFAGVYLVTKPAAAVKPD